MHKSIAVLIGLVVLGGVLLADAPLRQSGARPLYAPDLIKVKLTAEADARAALPQGLYASAERFGINELDQLMSVNGGIKVIRAHRQVKDSLWSQREGWDRWFLIPLNGRASVEDALKSFKANRYIEIATPEYLAYTTAVPNDTYYANNWGHNNTAQLPVYQSGGHTGAGVGMVGFDSDAQLAWDQSQVYGSDSIIIAIIDTGVDTAHPDLRLVTGYDYGDNDSNPMDNSADPGHGTACSGVAAGIANNNLGVTGVAGGCSVMPLKVADSAGDMYFTAIENAISHAADYNAHIISMSLGAQGYGEGSVPSTDAALYYAYNAGVAIFAATANANTSTLAYPSNHTAVISVGAASPCGQRKSDTSCDGEYWWGSNYGTAVPDAKEAVDIMAPTILPATDISGSGGYSTTDYYMWFNGTSCATPYAAGVAALVLSKDPSLTPAQLRTVLVNSATDMTYDGGAGWDRYTGYGMVNANTALSLLSDFNPPMNLAATGGNGVVYLTWEAPIGATPTGYKIYKDSVLQTTVTGLSYDDYAVVNGTSYSYYLIAVYSGGESDPTPTVQATPNIITAVVIGSGTSASGTTDGCPINIWYRSLHGQSVYTKAELNAAGLFGPATITQVGFYVNSLPTLALPSFIIRMKHTTAVNVASWIPASGMTTVYSATSYMPTAGNYDMLTLSTPFEWNGNDNIVIDTAFGLVANYYSTGTTRYSTYTNGYRFVRNDNTDQTTVFSGGSISSYRPNVKLTFLLPQPEIAVSPPSLAYGTVNVGSSSSLQFTIQNTGNAILTGSITTPAGYSVAAGAKGIRNTLNYSIPALSSQDFDLTFTPTDAISYSGNLTISSNDTANPTEYIALSGSGRYPHMYGRFKAFLEGPYVARGSMNHALVSVLPLTSPYNVNHSVTALPDLSPRQIVDWVYLELRLTANGATVQAVSAFLLDDGNLADLTGSTTLAFDHDAETSFYVVLRHRNHLGVMSATAHELALTAGAAPLIDLSALDSVYGGNQTGVKQVEAGVLALISGDADGDGGVLPTDLNLYWRMQTGLSGYRSADFDLDGTVLPSDLNLCWRVNSGLQSQIPAPSGKTANRQ